MLKATTRREKPATFKPCLEVLEERFMLDGSPSTPPTSVPPVQLSQSQVFTEMALTVQTAPFVSGQQEISNGPYNTLQQVSNNWNVLAGAINSIDLGKLGPLAESLAESVKDSIKEGVNSLALQAVSRLPVGTAHAGGDYALAVLGTLQMFEGSIKKH